MSVHSSRHRAWPSHCGHAVALLGAILLLQGCATIVAGGVVGGAVGAYRANGIEVKQGASVQIHFRPAADISSISRARDTSTMTATELIVGRVLFMHGDTVLVRASEVRAGGKRLLFSIQDAPAVIVPPGAGALVEPTADPFIYVVVGVVVGVTVTIVGLYALCAATGCFN